MLLRDLVKLPKKKERKDLMSTNTTFWENVGYNQTIDQIGNIEIELDVGKIKEILFSAPRYGKGWIEIEKTAQAIADNFKDIIKDG